MPFPCTPAASPLLNEHLALCRTYAEAQERCSRHMAAQRAEVARLQDEVLRLRGQALVLTTALAWERAGQSAVVLPMLAAAVVDCGMEGATNAAAEGVVPLERAPCQHLPLHSSLAEANLVVCQVGCLSHSAYWRTADDQCRRSGQTCVVVASANALQAAAALSVPAGPLV